jgi:hypothetical protein
LISAMHQNLQFDQPQTHADIISIFPLVPSNSFGRASRSAKMSVWVCG